MRSTNSNNNFQLITIRKGTVSVYNKLKQLFNVTRWGGKKKSVHIRTITPCSRRPFPHEVDPSICFSAPSNPRNCSNVSVSWAHRPAASWKPVDFDVFWQVVTAGELLFADGTLVGLDPRVGPSVAGELVGPRKPGGKEEGERCLTFADDSWERVKSRGSCNAGVSKKLK